MKYSSLVLLTLFTLTSNPVLAEGKKPEITRGTYAHPKAFWDAGHRLDDFGINAVFIHARGIDEATFQRAKAEGARVFAEFATLNGNYGNYVKEHPDAHPIDDSGNPAPPATWFMGVCPTHEGFKKFRHDDLRKLLTEHDLDGVFLDYTHWHAQFEDPYPVLMKTCFNDSCLSAFEKWAGIKVEGETTADKAKWIFGNAPKEWEDWRVSVITDWIKECRDIIKEIRPNALVGIYHTAWKDSDLSGVRRRALGLDFEQMAEYIDIFSPMIYCGRSGKEPEYVKEFVDYLSDKPFIQNEAGKYPQIWPIVQATDQPRVTTPEELEKTLRYGLSNKSTGVMMFTMAAMAASPEKLEVMKKVYTEFSPKE